MASRNALKNTGNISLSVLFLKYIFFLLCDLMQLLQQKNYHGALVLLEDRGPGFSDAVPTASAN